MIVIIEILLLILLLHTIWWIYVTHDFCCQVKSAWQSTIWMRTGTVLKSSSCRDAGRSWCDTSTMVTQKQYPSSNWRRFMTSSLCCLPRYVSQGNKSRYVTEVCNFGTRYSDCFMGLLDAQANDSQWKIQSFLCWRLCHHNFCPHASVHVLPHISGPINVKPGVPSSLRHLTDDEHRWDGHFWCPIIQNLIENIQHAW